MSQAQQRRSNGNGKSSGSGARSKLELQDSIVQGADGVPILDHVNLGQGNYSTDDYWQQIRSYRRGLYLHTAFQSTLTKRAIRETKFRLGEEGYNAIYDNSDADVKSLDPADVTDISDLDPDEITAEDSRRRQILDRGEEIWERLGEPDQVISEAQVAALMEKTGVGMDWLPISWEMVVGRHEASRSRDAELIRDVFSQVSHFRADGDGAAIGQLMGGKP